jgi:GNAT superfamily N-acetyltransferase
VYRTPNGPSREAEYIRSLLNNAMGRLFVAEEDGRLGGFVYVYVCETAAIPIRASRRFAEVDTIGVRRDWQRTGVGRALMARAHEWAKAHGVDSIQLNVYEFNRGAIAFYEALGYTTLSRKMTLSLDEHAADAHTDHRG